jgi:hypothetical protein
MEETGERVPPEFLFYEKNEQNSRVLVLQEMVTYKRSSANAEWAGLLADVAVSCTDDCVGIDERASTQVTISAKLNADDERQVTLGSGYATNNVLSVLIPVLSELLRDSCTIDEGRNRKSGDDGFGVHIDEIGEREAGRSLSWREKRLTGFYRLVIAPFL